ncbi:MULTISPECIES: Eco57I restriction-modification methylase domain-containing protein [Clostridium]|uniref:Eco57I restriction-modification methylase domain-containing protein n=1 Tax=Clostridium TaxID=1485 RepID=UPI0008267E8E|nr:MULTISPECIES: N-6 DNA methylase [Clostridium]PJI09732.1 class I SAM-dependent DNA methyltransferase [Clostridium sp. CT7]
MIEEFLYKIDVLYNSIKKADNEDEAVNTIKNYKKALDINGSFSEEYSKIISMKKERGIVYTPLEISNYIVKNTITKKDIISNPFLKIIDPACGCGNIIIPCFLYLKDIYLRNLDIINKTNNLKLKRKDINYHIVKNNLFGYDVDLNAVKILFIDLLFISGCISHNFLCSDFLIQNIKTKYDVFLSNPPYVGLKSINKDYSLTLKKMYSSYKDKGDVSYCFFEKSISSLKDEGKLGFITSRYFIESPSGEELRKILSETANIYKIVDFYGIRPFKNAGIDTVMIFLKKRKASSDKIEVIKPNILNNKKEFYDSLLKGKGKLLKRFYVNTKSLSNTGWILVPDEERNIISKIEDNSEFRLSDICESYQGIITGCDKAFIVDKDTILKENLEQCIIRPWIKNKDISKYNVSKESLYIIYSNFIDDPSKYPNVMRHIGEYKDRLEKRRECKKGIRKWYELQWGRKSDIFEREKIVFPYKASRNRFAIDKKSYFSADVYCLATKEKVSISYEYLLDILNSKIYEFYFKAFAKKLGENIYEYYPNNLMKLCIPDAQGFNRKFTEKMLYDKFKLSTHEIEIINFLI